jgi:glycosyltransferase involved in cell wall biosynthesis
MRRPYNLAIVSTHPIQYHAPWFRGLAAHPDVNIHVYYCHVATPEEQARAGFGVAFEWDVPLLEGYPYTFMRNVADPAGPDRFAGFDTPEIKNIILRGQYDAVLINGWHYKSAWQAILACWRSDVKAMVRGDSHLHTPRSLPVRLAKSLAYPRFIPRFDACLAVGQWSREYFLHYGASPERIFLVPHTVDIARMAAQSECSQTIHSELRKRWKLHEDSIVFVFVGKFTDAKRPMDFVRAVCEARKQKATVQGLMVGDGPLRNVCEDFARTHHVPMTFTGFLNQSEIMSAYAAADVLVLPSVGETWGMVVNEAMACKRPCIVSDRVGCGPDLIRAGETGVVFPQGEVDALVVSMIEFAKQPSRLAIMGAHARERVEKYSVQTAVEGVLQSLAAGTDSRVLHAIAD